MNNATLYFLPPQSSLRFVASLPAAGLLTLSLLAFMQWLVITEFVDSSEPDLIKIAPIILPKDSGVAPIYGTTKPEPPLPVTQTPSTTLTKPNANQLTYNQSITTPVITHDNATEITIDFNSSTLVKQVMIAPVYPRRAAARGIEGFVDVQFVVTEKGSTKDIKIINAEPKNIFEDSAIAAVEHWKYRPISLDGKTQESGPIVERIRFNLER